MILRHQVVSNCKSIQLSPTPFTDVINLLAFCLFEIRNSLFIFSFCLFIKETLWTTTVHHSHCLCHITTQTHSLCVDPLQTKNTASGQTECRPVSFLVAASFLFMFLHCELGFYCVFVDHFHTLCLVQIETLQHFICTYFPHSATLSQYLTSFR